MNDAFGQRIAHVLSKAANEIVLAAVRFVGVLVGN
jgi:hypothetical protein